MKKCLALVVTCLALGAGQVEAQGIRVIGRAPTKNPSVETVFNILKWGTNCNPLWASKVLEDSRERLSRDQRLIFKGPSCEARPPRSVAERSQQARLPAQSSPQVGSEEHKKEVQLLKAEIDHLKSSNEGLNSNIVLLNGSIQSSQQRHWLHLVYVGVIFFVLGVLSIVVVRALLGTRSRNRKVPQPKTT